MPEQEAEQQEPSRKVYVVCASEELLIEVRDTFERAKNVLELFSGWSDYMADLDEDDPQLGVKIAGMNMRMGEALWALYPPPEGRAQMDADIVSMSALALTQDVKLEGGSH